MRPASESVVALTRTMNFIFDSSYRGVLLERRTGGPDFDNGAQNERARREIRWALWFP
jgi:hypothetical protein